jgi:hypothetical protein
LTLCNFFLFLTLSIHQISILLQHHISKQAFQICIRSFKFSAPLNSML